MGETVARNM